MELVIFIGLQASGKSAFYRRFAGSHLHVSKDNFPKAKNRQKRQMALIESAFQSGYSVVVDNTNPSKLDRAPLVEMGHMWGTKVVGYYFEPRLEECLARNRLRGGKARVPDVAIYTTLKKLEPPTYSEGFDELYSIRLNEPRGFVIEPYQTEQ